MGKASLIPITNTSTDRISEAKTKKTGQAHHLPIPATLPTPSRPSG